MKIILTTIVATLYGLATPLEAKTSPHVSPAVLQTQHVPNQTNDAAEIIPIAGQKTVKVRSYYRKDGTYVRGHYRSRPTCRTPSRQYYPPNRSYSKNHTRTYSRRK